VNLARKVTIMRLSLLTLLLLTTATTAIAAQPELEGAQTEEREAREPRLERAERPGRPFREGAEAPRQRMPERVERVEPVQQVERAERIEPRASAPEPIRDVARSAVAQPRGEDWNRSRGENWSRSDDRGSNQGWREERGERRGRARDIPPAASPVFGSAVPAPGTVTSSGRDLRDRIAGEGLRRDRVESENWRREWRQDRRYDWRRHRDRDRSRFHLGFYIDPFGWNYRDWDIGWRLPSRYFASRYWVYDPWSYRLPPVSGPYRWIRYHNDVLLVDLRSGRVLDRIRSFFW
jgi:Ni/Co efflux regulator RcnB